MTSNVHPERFDKNRPLQMRLAPAILSAIVDVLTTGATDEEGADMLAVDAEEIAGASITALATVIRDLSDVDTEHKARRFSLDMAKLFEDLVDKSRRMGGVEIADMAAQRPAGMGEAIPPPSLSHTLHMAMMITGDLETASRTLGAIINYPPDDVPNSIAEQHFPDFLPVIARQKAAVIWRELITKALERRTDGLN